MKVRFSESAAAVYDDAVTRLRAVNRFAAERFADKVGQAVWRIGRYPQSGHFVPEYAKLPVRQFIVEPYRFFYYVDERAKLIRIIDVWHGAQIPAYPNLPDVGAPR
jgi:plasmid stabilization system protein ParE